MNKKLITLAVAAALAAPAAAMAEATLYGKVHVSIDYVDVDDFANWGSVPAGAGLPGSDWTDLGNVWAGGFVGAQTSFLDTLIRGAPDPFNEFAPGTTAATQDATYSTAALTPAQVTNLNAIAAGADAQILAIQADPATTPAQKTELVAGVQEQEATLILNELYGNLAPADTLVIGDTAYTIAELTNIARTLTGDPFADYTAIVNINAPGTTATYDPATGIVTTSLNAFELAYSIRLADLESQGVEFGVADVVATRDALQFAVANATDQQLAAAQRDAVLAAQGQSFKGWTLNGNSRASRLGVKGSEDLGNGLKAIYQIEFQVPITNENDNIADGDRNGIKMRNSFVGLAGNFGTFLVGRHDTPLKISTAKLDLFSDTLADYNYTIGFQDVRADNAIAYISPSFSGFSLAAALIPAGGASPLGDYNVNNDSIGSAWSIAAIYSNGPFYASVAYENLTDDHWTGMSDPLAGTIYQDVTRNDVITGLYGSGARDDTKWRVGLGLLDWNGFTLTGIYEARSNVQGVPKSADMNLWQIQAGYAFGNNMIKGMYGQADVDKCADPFGYGYMVTCSTYGLGLVDNQDTSAWSIAFDHNFSKRTKAYALYTQMDSDQKDADWSGFSLGMIHSF